MNSQNDWRWNPQWRKAHLIDHINYEEMRPYQTACGKTYSDWYTAYGGKYTNLGIRCTKCSLVATMRELSE